TFNVIMRDTSPPAIQVPADVTLEATGPNGATGIFTVTVTDLVSQNLAATCTPASGSIFALGSTGVNCLAKDAAGNIGRGSFNVVVKDTTAPAIASVTPSQTSLWPPEHQMVPMTVAVSASDRVDGAPVCRIATITSSEVVNGLGDGDSAPDWTID